MSSIKNCINHKKIVLSKFICYYIYMEKYELERRKIVAENIKKLIKEKGITQKQLAKEIGMSQNIITEYVKLRSFPPGGVLQKIADYFEVKKSDIDTTWKKDVNSEYTVYINETIDNMKKLDEERQENVLNFSKNQLQEQNQEIEKEKVIALDKENSNNTDIDDDGIDWNEWVAFDGKPMTNHDKQVLKDYFGDELKD